jgi:hypothetical protein
LGRIMVRSRLDPDLDTLWSFITREDFEKTSSSPENIPHHMELFSKIVSLPRIAAIFWQHGADSGTEGMLWSEDETLLKRAANELGSTVTNNLMVSFPTYENFIDAETQARKLLRTLL